MVCAAAAANGVCVTVDPQVAAAPSDRWDLTDRRNRGSDRRGSRIPPPPDTSLLPAAIDDVLIVPRRHHTLVSVAGGSGGHGIANAMVAPGPSFGSTHRRP